MRTTNFDAIAAAAPLDRQASVVRDGSGDLYDGKVPTWHAHWEAPPLPEKPMPAGTPDLAGQKAGDLSAIRYHTSHKTRGAMWLVRCVCGDYEIRAAAAFRKMQGRDLDEGGMRCAKCDWFRKVKRRASLPNGMSSRARDTARLDEIARQQRERAS